MLGADVPVIGMEVESNEALMMQDDEVVESASIEEAWSPAYAWIAHHKVQMY